MSRCRLQEQRIRYTCESSYGRCSKIISWKKSCINWYTLCARVYLLSYKKKIVLSMLVTSLNTELWLSHITNTEILFFIKHRVERVWAISLLKQLQALIFVCPSVSLSIDDVNAQAMFILTFLSVVLILSRAKARRVVDELNTDGGNWDPFLFVSNDLDESPNYDITRWVRQLHLQQCAFVEIGEGFCAVSRKSFRQNTYISSPINYRTNSMNNQFRVWTKT